MRASTAKRVRAKLTRIQALASQTLDLLEDDPMYGDLWSALNRINADASESLSEYLPAVAPSPIPRKHAALMFGAHCVVPGCSCRSLAGGRSC